MSYHLECAGLQGGWEVWALLHQRLECRSIAGMRAVTAQRAPLAILLRRAGDTRAFALTPDLSDPEALAALIRKAR